LPKWKIVKDGRVLGYDNNYNEALKAARVIGATVQPAEKPVRKSRQTTLPHHVFTEAKAEFEDSLLGKCRFKSFYLVNDLYGGYSYTCEKGFGSADFIPAAEVLRIAEQAGIKTIHLAGGRWEEIGYKGWGEEVSLEEAKKALAKLKEKYSSKISDINVILSEIRNSTDNPYNIRGWMRLETAKKRFCEACLAKLFREGKIYEPRPGFIAVTEEK